MYTFKKSTEDLIVFDPGSRNTLAVRGALASYKKRWQESLASTIAIASTLEEIPKGSNIIVPEFVMYQLNPLHYEKITTVPSIQQITHYDLRRSIVNPIVTQFNDVTEFISHIEDLNLTIAAFDFETAGKYTSIQKESMKLQLEVMDEGDETDRIWLRQQIAADGLSHPSLCRLTHLSIASSETESFVCTISKDSEQAIAEWLVETEITQVWHNTLFDLKHIYYRTQKTPKSIEDTEMLAKVYLNNTQNHLAKVGLKGLAKKVYGDWGSDIKNLFNIESMHDPRVCHYAGIDTCATMFVWNEYSIIDPVGDIVALDSLLPIVEPRLHSETPRYFYENAIKSMIPHAIRLMYNGINLDQEKASKLDDVLIDVLSGVKDQLASNKIIQDFRANRYTALRQKKVDELNSKKRSRQYYLKEYKDTDVVHRSYVVNEYLRTFEANNFTFDLSFWPADVLPDGSTKWTVNDVKKMRAVNALPLLDSIIDKSIALDDPLVQIAMYNLAEYKRDKYNDGYDLQINDIDLSIVPEFNPGSSLQLRELFEFLDIEPLAFTKKDGASWGREQVEEIQKTTTDKDVAEMCTPLIQYSQSSIIKTNFIEGFKKYVIDGTLYGNFKLFGAKTARPTSKQINLLNLPSTGSIYASPVKKCLTPFDGDILYTVDLSALEDRVIASLSKDESKCNIFKEGLDGHSLNACGYFKEEVEAIVGNFDDDVERVKAFMQAVADGNKEAKAIRQKGKGPTFGLAYGAYPPKVAATIKCSLPEAEKIFNRYHNELYGGITKYREEYVLPTAQANGRLHLLLGLFITSDDARRDIRTLNNSTVQAFSLITLITMCRVNELIDEAGYTNDIRIMASIYDSLYYSVTPDPVIIKWLNDTIIPVMTQEYIIGEEIHNEAEGEIGTNFSELLPLTNNAGIQEIQGAIDECKV